MQLEEMGKPNFWSPSGQSVQDTRPDLSRTDISNWRVDLGDMPKESNTGLETLSAKWSQLLSEFKIALRAVEAPGRARGRKALLKQGVSSKLDGATIKAKAELHSRFPANVTLF